jgi:hypothetical protein
MPARIRIRKLRDARHTHAGGAPGAAADMTDYRKEDKDDCVFYKLCWDESAFANDDRVCGPECPPGRWHAPKKKDPAK